MELLVDIVDYVGTTWREISGGVRPVGRSPNDPKPRPHGLNRRPYGQGFKDMSPPTKELMRLVLEGKVAHDGHPVLHWMIDNIFIRTDPAGNIKPDKEKSAEKIDGVVAAIMGLDRAIRRGAGPVGASVRDERGLLLL